MSATGGTRWPTAYAGLMVLGKDLCTGTLMNNTSQNKKPYILTANHCIDTP